MAYTEPSEISSVVEGETMLSTDDDGDGVLSSRRSSPQRSLSPTSPPLTPAPASTSTALGNIAGADVPHAIALYSTDGVVVRYVIRFVDSTGFRWCVEKRYSDILAVHEVLREEYERTRSFSTKLSSLIGPSKKQHQQGRSDLSSTPSPPTRAPSSSSLHGDIADPAASESAANRDSALPFPKFPSKALSKSKNQSIKFILDRRRELSHYFSNVVRCGCRCFIKTTAAQVSFCEFARPPSTLLASTVLSQTGAANMGSAMSTNSESAYYFRENDDGFLTVEQKQYVYAYFSVPHGFRQCSVADWCRRATTHLHVSPGVTPQQPSRRSSGVSDDGRFVLPTSQATARTHVSQDGNSSSPHSRHSSNYSHGSPVVGGQSSSVTIQRSAGLYNARTQSRQSTLESNGCLAAMIPTLTIALPYCRIVHDIHDTTRMIVALRCDKMENRAEVLRRRDELLAFYKHIGNGSVDRLPDVHEAKRFFVNYRRDNPLQDYGVIQIANMLCSGSKDRLPSATPASSPPTRRRHSTNDRESPLTEADEDADVEDGCDDDDDGGSIIVSLASLRSARGATACHGVVPSVVSTAASTLAPALPVASASAGHLLARSAPSDTNEEVESLPVTVTTPSVATAPHECSNSKHFVVQVISSSVGGPHTVTSTPLDGCACTTNTFCKQLSTLSSQPQQSCSLKSTQSASKRTQFVAFQSASGFQINVHAPTCGEHKRRRDAKASSAASRQ